MISFVVIVTAVLGEDSQQRTLAEQDHFRQALLLDRAHPAFGERGLLAGSRIVSYHHSPGLAEMMGRTWNRRPAAHNDRDEGSHPLSCVPLHAHKPLRPGSHSALDVRAQYVGTEARSTDTQAGTITVDLSGVIVGANLTFFY